MQRTRHLPFAVGGRRWILAAAVTALGGGHGAAAATLGLQGGEQVRLGERILRHDADGAEVWRTSGGRGSRLITPSVCGYAFENGDGAESSVNKNKGEYERGLYAHDQRL